MKDGVNYYEAESPNKIIRLLDEKKDKIEINEEFVNIKDRVKNHYIKNQFEILETRGITGGLKAIKDSA